MQKLSMDQLARTSVQEFKDQPKSPIVLVLDNVRSLHNVGSIFRTSDGFAVERLILCGITGTPPHREIEKTALGATASVEWTYREHVLDAIDELKDSGYVLCALEQTTGSIPLDTFRPDPNARYALVFGNEVNGVSDSVLQRADTALEIPQFGTKHSFNVSVAAGIVLWDFFCKRG